jgi:hypothetical protein
LIPLLLAFGIRTIKFLFNLFLLIFLRFAHFCCGEGRENVAFSSFCKPPAPEIQFLLSWGGQKKVEPPRKFHSLEKSALSFLNFLLMFLPVGGVESNMFMVPLYIPFDPFTYLFI